MRPDGSRDLRPEKRLILWAPANSGEQGRIACRCQMRPKVPNIALEKVNALRRQRVVERLPVLYLLGRNDDVEGLALARPDEISLDVELCQVAHANRGHQQDLDGSSQLSQYRPALAILMPPGLTHQLLWELQQRADA